MHTNIALLFRIIGTGLFHYCSTYCTIFSAKEYSSNKDVEGNNMNMFVMDTRWIFDKKEKTPVRHTCHIADASTNTNISNLNSQYTEVYSNIHYV